MRKILACLVFALVLGGIGSAQERPELLLQRGHTGGDMRAQAVSGDSRLAYTVNEMGGVKVWSMNTRQVLRTIYDAEAFPDPEQLGKISAAAFSPSTDWVATIDDQGFLRRFSLPAGELLDSRQTALSRGARELLTDGEFIYLLSYDSLIKINLKSGETQKADIDGGQRLSLSAEAGQLALIHKESRTLSVLRTSDLSPTVSRADLGLLRGVEFSADGGKLAVVEEKAAYVLDSSDLSQQSRAPLPPQERYLDHKPLWLDSELFLFRYRNNGSEALLQFDFESSTLQEVAKDCYALSASLTPDGRIFFGGYGGKSWIYDPSTGEREALERDLGGFTAFAFHPDSRYLFTGTRQGHVFKWSPENGRMIQRLEGLRNYVSGLELSPDGTKLLGAENTRGRIVCWDVESGRELSRVEQYIGGTFGDGVHQLEWVDSKSFFYVARGKPLSLISAETGEVLKSWDVEGQMNPVTLAVRDGRVFACYKRGTVLEASVDSKRDILIQKLPIRHAPEQVAYGPHSETVFLTTQFGGVSTLYRWNTADPDSELVSLTKIRSGVADMKYREGALTLSLRNGQILTLSDEGKEVGTLQLADDSIWKRPVVVGGLLMTIADKGKLCFYDLNNGERLGQLVSVRNDEGWVALKESGSFDGNDVGLQVIQFSLGDELYGVDQFLTQYLRPGLLAELLPGSKKTLRTAEPLTSVTVRKPPVVRILEPASGSTVAGQSAKVKVEVTPRGFGATEPSVYHNGHKLPQSGLQKVDGTTYLYEVKLVRGLNELQASAFDGSDQVESRRDRVRLKAPEVEERPPRLHLLSVGIDAYGSDLKLEFADEDAQSISELFQSDLYASGIRVLLKNEEATETGISEAVNRIAESAEPQDAFVFYMAGHGTVVSDTYYFLPQDVETNSDQELEKSALSAEMLSKMLASVPATKQLLVLDTCRAGKFLKGAGELYARAGLEDVRSHNLLSRTSGTFLIAATKEQDYAFEIPELGHGILTFSVLEAMGAKVEGEATTITANELLRAVSEKVPELSQKYHGTRQNVVQYSSGQDFPLTK